MVASALGALILALLCAGLFLPLEFLFPRRGVRLQLGTIAGCVALLVLNTVLMRAVGQQLLGAVGTRFATDAEPSAGRLLLAFVLGDLAAYWLHRAMHASPLLWRLHRVHHAEVELTWVEAWRQHPVDFVLHGIVIGLPSALLGATLSDVVALVLLRKAWTVFLHSDVRLRFGPLEWLLATPEFHRVHHSHDPRDYNRNLAGTLPVWDALFGTLRLSPRRGPGLAVPPRSAAASSAPAAP